MEWRINKLDVSGAEQLVRVLGVSRPTAEILVNRGLAEVEAARIFLKPALGDLPSPFLLPDLDRAVDRLIQALNTEEQITVYGDYDADGLTATALLTGFLESLGGRVSTYVPHRLEEGYGLNIPAIEHLIQTGTRLLITVDCGVSDREAVQRARELGLDVIITDHHQVPPLLPPALAVINPQRPQSRFPQRNLAGVGVAFFLAGGLRQTLRERGLITKASQPELAPLLGLVALGTVADVAPLTKINRILVSMGLQHLISPRSPGLAALKEVGDLAVGRPLTARDIAFRLAPRLNAAGRLGSAAPGLLLLLARDPEPARDLAAELERLNSERRRLQEKVLKEAEEMLEQSGPEPPLAIVMAKEDWHRGVVGLVAAKLAEKYRRPAILFNLADGLARGSGRSIDGFNLFNALNRCQDLLLRFGGHEQAAGLTLASEQLSLLIEAFGEIVGQELSTEILDQTLIVDTTVSLSDLAILLKEIPLLAPFGQGNPEPVLAIKGLTVVSAGNMGGRHLKLTLSDGRQSIETVGFNLGHLLPELGRRVSVAIQSHASFYRGELSTGWKVVDVRREPAVQTLS